MLRTSDKIPLTGIDRFDRLIVGTNTYQKWADNLRRWGFTITETALRPGNPANIVGHQVFVDPKQFRYIDLLHESRHIAQIRRAEKLGLNPFNFTKIIKLFEAGAYRYELKLSRKFGFSRNYIEWIETRINDFMTPSLSKYIRFNRRVQGMRLRDL